MDLDALFGSPSGFSLVDLERGTTAQDDVLFTGRFSDGFYQRSEPEGNVATADDSKRRKTVVQVVDDSTDLPLPTDEGVSTSAATRRVSDLALRATNVKQFKFLGRKAGWDGYLVKTLW